MNKEEAKKTLNQVLNNYRQKTYSELVKLIENQETFEIIGVSGTIYQIEIQAFWDIDIQNELHVMGSIDDKSFIKVMFPITETFIMKSDDTLSE